jgi:hypothetical protein
MKRTKPHSKKPTHVRTHDHKLYVGLLEAYWLVDAYFGDPSKPKAVWLRDYLLGEISDAIIFRNRRQMAATLAMAKKVMLGDDAAVMKAAEAARSARDAELARIAAWSAKEARLARVTIPTPSQATN